MLWALKIRGALIISIALTTVIAFITGVAQLPAEFTITPNFSTLGLGLQDLGGIFTIPTGVLGAVLAIFTIMLSDFFDTMGTVTGVAAEAGLAEEDGTVPGVGRVLLVDGLAAAVGGAAGVSSNTTYIESAAGVADGGRTGLTSVVVGILFLAAILLSPLAAIIPTQATAPALVLVGFLMFTQIGEIDARDFLIGFPALLIIILMPLTFTITIGIGAGMVVWVLLQVVTGRARPGALADVARLPCLRALLRPDLGQRHARGLTAADRPMAPGRANRPGATLSVTHAEPALMARGCASMTSTTACRPRPSPRSRPSHATLPGCWSWIVAAPRPGRPHLRTRPSRSSANSCGAGDLLVANDSRVIRARLPATRSTGGAAEVLMLRPMDDGSGRWEALVRPSRRVAVGDPLTLRSGDTIEVGERLGGGTRAVRFARDPLAVMEAAGEMPLPPYIRDRSSPPERYQTVYARPPGSAAAPTAGLHFTERLLADLADRGVRRANVTLHVGLDTFRPLEGEFVDEHQIHREWYEIPRATARAMPAARRGGGRIVAVGTTTMRVLETRAHGGPASGWSELYITPPYEFRAVDALITNFHLPRSSLLLLVTAFVQAGMRRATPYRGARHAAGRIPHGAGRGVSVLQLRRRDADRLISSPARAGRAAAPGP